MATVGRHVGCSFHRFEGDRLPEGRRIKSVWPQKAICAEPIRSGHCCQRVGFELYSAVSASNPGFLRFGSADCAISSRKSCKKHMASTETDSQRCGGSLGWMPPGRKALQERLPKRSVNRAANCAHRSTISDSSLPSSAPRRPMSSKPPYRKPHCPPVPPAPCHPTP